ncbi:MarR family protein [compost metagenome]|jgi:DNA-binding MarR family transcriptional regulator
MIFNSDYLIVPLLAGFEWFDESLQMSLREAGWPHLTRPESMVMMHVQMEVVRPADIARSLRLTRQAVHSTINALVERGVFELVDDPTDGRIRIVQLTPMGKAMRQDAQKIVAHLTDELGRRIGARRVKALRESFAGDWGPPVVHALADPGSGIGAFHQRQDK